MLFFQILLIMCALRIASLRWDMMPLPSRVVGMSMEFLMEDLPQMYTSEESTCSHLQGLLLLLVVRCLVAFQMCLLSISTYTIHLVALSLELQREEAVTSKGSLYQMLKWKTSTWHWPPLASVGPIQMKSMILVLYQFWTTSPCGM